MLGKHIITKWKKKSGDILLKAVDSEDKDSDIDKDKLESIIVARRNVNRAKIVLPGQLYSRTE